VLGSNIRSQQLQAPTPLPVAWQRRDIVSEIRTGYLYRVASRPWRSSSPL